MVRLLPHPGHELSWRNPFVLTLEGVLTEDECRSLIHRIETLGPEPAPISTFRGEVRRPDVRNNDRVMLDDPALAQRLFDRIKAQVPERLEVDWRLVGANERLRFYRYSSGQRFAPHFDGSFQRSSTERSLVTFLVYLNSCEKGGATRLTDLDLEVTPAPGRALLFNHFLLHEGAIVSKGLKYVVRSDLMYRRD